jgi:hypothetical protein
MFVENIVRGEKALIVSCGGFSVNESSGAVRQRWAGFSARRGGVPDNKRWAALGGTAKFIKSDPFSVKNSLPMKKVAWRVPEECEFRSDDQVSVRVSSLRISFDDLIIVARDVTNDGIMLHDGNLKWERHSRRWVY